MNRVYNSIFGLLIGAAIVIPTKVKAQDTLTVDSNGGELGLLNGVIDGDTTETGERVHAVYRLLRGQTYVLDAAIEHDGYHLNIVAEDGDGARPRIVPGVLDGPISSRPFRPRSDLTLKGLYVTGENTLGSLNPDLRIIRVASENVRLVLDDCFLEKDGQSAIRLDNEGARVHIINSIVANIGTPNNIDNGRVVDDRGNDVDTLVFDNNTFYNISSRVLRDGGGIIKYAKVVNNTTFNTGQRSFAFGEVVKLEFRDNIIVNPAFLGSEQDEDPNNAGSPDPLDIPEAHFVVDSVDADVLAELGTTQNVTISNLNIYVEQAVLDARPERNPDPEDSDFVVSRPTFSNAAQTFIDDAGTGETIFEEVLVFSNPAVTPAQLIEEWWADFDGNDDVSDWDLSGQPFEFNYQDTYLSATASTTGGQIGSLQWELIATGISGLRNAITEAETLIAEATAGTNIGNYPQEAIDAFQTALDAAKVVAENTTATDQQIEDATTALTTAQETFLGFLVTGIDDLQLDRISVYPNPTTEYLVIDDLEVVGVSIHSLSGQLLAKGQLDSSRKVSVSPLDQGIYVLKLIYSDGGQSSVRFIKK